jgi:uncharacterized protein HemX
VKLDDEQMEKEIRALGRSHVPREGWKGRVRDGIEQRPSGVPAWVAAGMAVMTVLVVGLRIYLYVADQNQRQIVAQKEVEKKAAEDALAQQKKDIEDTLAKIRATDEETAKLIAQLKATQDANEQKRLESQIVANDARKKAEAERLETIRRADYTRRTMGVMLDKCKASTDPNCGL